MENGGPGSRGPGLRDTRSWATGSRGVENTGSGGKHGVQVKNTGEPISPNYEFSSLK